jgi:hypothetical protein
MLKTGYGYHDHKTLTGTVATPTYQPELCTIRSYLTLQSTITARALQGALCFLLFFLLFTKALHRRRPSGVNDDRPIGQNSILKLKRRLFAATKFVAGPVVSLRLRRAADTGNVCVCVRACEYLMNDCTDRLLTWCLEAQLRLTRVFRHQIR